MVQGSDYDRSSVMWVTSFIVDSRKNCFITVPRKWGVDTNQLTVFKIQQTCKLDDSPVFATCIGDSGPSGGDKVVIGKHFARTIDLNIGKEAIFQILSNNVSVLSTAIAEPFSADDWELLELNVDQVQSQILNKIRVVWKGAQIPIWLSDFVSVYIKIVDLEPSCAVGVLASDTEIHITPPKLKPLVPSELTTEKYSVASVLSQILQQFSHKPKEMPKISPVKELTQSKRNASIHIASHNEVLKLGGTDDLLQKCTESITIGLGLLENSPSFVASGCRHGNILLTGPRGSGRTSIARYLSNKLVQCPHYVYSVYVECSTLKGKKIETLRREWQSTFNELVEKQPSLLVLDDLDLLTSCSQSEHGDDFSGENFYYLRVAELLEDLISQTPFHNQVIILATALSGKSLHPKCNHYQSYHMFTFEFPIPSLNHAMRVDILRILFERKEIMVKDRDQVLARIAQQMDGYVAADIDNLVMQAAHAATSESGCTRLIVVQGKHLEELVTNYIPFGLHGVNLKPPSDCRKTWSDVGGLSEAKRLLKETLEWPTQYPDLLSRCPIRLRSALLLYGAPGTGKTLLASAVATECAVNFISIKGPELLSKFIGASEESVRSTFQRARSAKPCILFFDEFDSLAPRRGHDSTGVTDRVVNQLLTELDGVEGQEMGLWVLAATSRPDLIDPALLRPGRFDVTVHCALPSREERLEILKALSTKLDLTEGVFLDEISEKTKDFSGADIQALLYTAQLKALHDQQRVAGEKPGPIVISQEHLESALRETRPSVTASERQRYEKIYEHFQNGRSVNSNETQLPNSPSGSEPFIGQPRQTLA